MGSSAPDHSDAASEKSPTQSSGGTNVVRRHRRGTKWTVFLSCIALMTVVMWFSGYVGPEFLPKDHYRHSETCSYHSCNQAPTGEHEVRVFSRKDEDDRRITTYYIEVKMKLCDKHARCARIGHWPESNIYQAVLNALAFGTVLGLILGWLALRVIPKPTVTDDTIPTPDPNA